jgi:hypothetical protein
LIEAFETAEYDRQKDEDRGGGKDKSKIGDGDLFFHLVYSLTCHF